MKILLFCSLLLVLPFTTSGCGASALPKDTSVDFDVIVVGAGMGGLSAATHLAANGMKVLLLEQNHKVGGCTSSFSRGGFNFDIALHEMSMGGGNGDGLMRHLFRQAGIQDKIELIQIPELGRTIFPGLDFVYPGTLEETVTSLKEKWPKESENIDRFFETMEKMNNEVLSLREIYFANPVAAMFRKLAVPFKQRTLSKYRNATLKEVLDDYFEDEKLKAVLAQFWVYHGPPPSEQWALINMIANYSYMKYGAWQFKGSSQALSNAYAERIVELGGTVKTSTLVTSINVEDNKVRGVEVESGEVFTSRYVVSNADPFQTFFKLIDSEHVPKKLKRKINSMKPSNSFVGVYLGLDVLPSHWGIEEYEVFYNTSWDYDAMYENSLAGRFKDSFMTLTFYTNLGDSFYAPEGKSVLVLNAYSDIKAWPKRGPEYEKQKNQMVDDLIGMAETFMPGLRDHIEVAEGMTPRTIESYTLNRGGIPYGWNFTPDQQDRISISTSIGGLYVVGAWTWPSHSVGMSQLSGYLAARLIGEEEK